MTAARNCPHKVARPFRPFNLRLTDGRQIPVVHHDFIMLSPNERFADVYQLDSSHSILDVFLILSVAFPSAAEVQPNSTSNGK